MRRAYCLLRENIARRHEVFVSGLRAAGYSVACAAPRNARRGDVLLIWNRRGGEEQIACGFELAGGTVVVAEEAYIRRNDFYALAMRYHNGGGQELIDDPARVAGLGVEPLPWREDGGHVLVCPNRFIGPQAALMPPSWAEETARAARKLTGREVRVRPHPRHVKEQARPLADDLAGAWACVVWWSAAGVAALLAGIPVIYRAPWWIASDAASPELGAVGAPPCGDRAMALRRIANAQFTPAEIASGLPFARLAA